MPARACTANRSRPARKRTRTQAPRRTKRARASHLTRKTLLCLKRLLAQPPRQCGIAADRWSPERVARLLRRSFGMVWTAAYAVRTLRRAGLRLRFSRAREPRLSLARRRMLIRLLRRQPAEVGLTGGAWSRGRIVELIEQRFGIRYSRQHIGRLIRTLPIAVPLARAERRLSTAQSQELRELLSQSPHAAGLSDEPGALWTRPLIVTLIARRFRVRYSAHSLRRALKRWDITFRVAAGSRRRGLDQKQATQLRQALERLPREEGLAGNVWTQRRIAELIQQRFGLKYRVQNVHRMLARWQIRPTHRTARGQACALNTHQLHELETLLARPPAESGYPGRRWSRALIAQIVLSRFNATYKPHSLTRVLRRQGIRLRARSALTAAAAPDALGVPLAAPLPLTPLADEPTQLQFQTDP
jgi:transposase